MEPLIDCIKVVLSPAAPLRRLLIQLMCSWVVIVVLGLVLLSSKKKAKLPELFGIPKGLPLCNLNSA